MSVAEKDFMNCERTVDIKTGQTMNVMEMQKSCNECREKPDNRSH